MLDAITLALYGRAARYGKKQNPEDMMSRHTGVCSAEVEFEVPEGRFRAEWQLNRARKDPKGNLQPAKRFLYDATGTPMTQRMREVDVELEKLIGLDYERFLRSAMLAQGDFARFLKANANERSELLESLTGTQIYSHLSALCHEETVRKEESLRNREQGLGEIKLLEPDVQEALKREMRQLKSALEADKNAAEVIRAEVERGRQLSQCLEKDRKLGELSIALEVDARRLAAEFEKLNQYRKAEVFLPALAKLTDRYQLQRVEGEALQLEIVDLHQANVLRPMESLSGGESFLASLALALGLSDLAGRNVRIDSLFIDEGFGSLDHDTLDVAVAALEGLRSGSKTVGVISHVDLLKERISAQLRVQPGPGGVSTIEAVAG